MPAIAKTAMGLPKTIQREKIIEFNEVKRRKSFEKASNDSIELQYLEKIFKTLQEIANSNDKILPEKKSEERIVELEKENKELKKKLEKSFPVHIITYLTICSLVLGISATLLVLRFCFGIYTIDPYYIICALLISLTLALTSIAAIKDWKEYVTNARG